MIGACHRRDGEMMQVGREDQDDGQHREEVGDDRALLARRGGIDGRGIVLEACQRLLEVGFGWFNLHRIWASTDSENRASQRVLEKLGMRREAHFVQNELVKGRYRDTIVFAITAAEYWRS